MFRTGNARHSQSVDERRIVQAARNEAIFRDANETVEHRRRELGVELPRIPFLCECSNPRCHSFVRLTAEEYEALRGVPTRFALIPGHESDGDEVVDRRDSYSIVEKRGPGRDVAEQTYQR
jgi:hypothetical protein